MRKLLLLVIIIITCSCAWADDETQNIMRTKEQREAEIEQAIKEIGGEIPEVDKVNFLDALKKSKNNFLRLYRARWQALGMTDKLNKAINDAYKEKTDELLWGTKSIQLVINQDVINNIQEAIAFKFAENYDDFLRDVEEKWGESLQNDLSDFYRRASIMLLAADKNPMMRAYIRQNTAAQDSGAKILEDVREKLSAKYPDLKVTGMTIAGGVALIFRKQLVKYFAKYAGKTVIFKKIAKSAAGKAIGKVIPLIGPIMIAWSVYDVASIAWNAESDTRKMLTERNLNMYSREMPAVYWDVMEPYVMDILISSYGMLQNTRKQAAIFADDPKMKSLSEGLSDTETMQFAERISAAVEILGNDKFNYLLENFGERIRESSPQNFRRLIQILQQENIEQANEWLNLAGNQYYDFYALFPQDIWTKFRPDSQSLELLKWMTRKLTPSARNTASKLSISDLRWIIDDLPERYVSQLFNEKGREPDAIHFEIERLNDLPKDSRIPWQSELNYQLSKYGFYIKIAVIAIVILILARIIIPMFRKKPQTVLQTQPQVIIMPPQVQQPQPFILTKKYDVKLIISPDFVSEARNTQWDMTQTLTPANDKDGNYIFSAKLDNLDNFSRWANRHKDSIKFIEPEELRQLINNI
ncbi:MAG: WYL domain-containing protein [Synergistaceae bacterium]|nr:WYL domain-containing protein [Synergistaceae bacterium]